MREESCFCLMCITSHAPSARDFLLAMEVQSKGTIKFDNIEKMDDESCKSKAAKFRMDLDRDLNESERLKLSDRLI